MNTQKARTIMRPISICLSKEMPLDKVSEHLSTHQLPGAPVIDENQRGIGYVSEHDCLKQLMQSTYYRDTTALAEDVMNPSLIAAAPDTSLMDLAQIFTENKINVIAIKELETIVGVVSRGDIMRALIKDLEESTNIN